MIKVGILGAETAAAGELIRILINHPDVSLRTVASECEAGRDVASMHRGLVGDIEMTVSATLDCAGHEAVFLCGEPWMARKWMQLNDAEAREWVDGHGLRFPGVQPQGVGARGNQGIDSVGDSIGH